MRTGIVSTALKHDAASPELARETTEWMTTLNVAARDAMLAAGAVAATDITGFGLLGHLGELVAASGVGADVDFAAVPLLPGVLDLIADGHVPGGTKRNLRHVAGFTDFGKATDYEQVLLADAQTSGGLLIAVDEAAAESVVGQLGEPAAVIGRLRDGAGISVL